jgi:uncharacterized protein (TIGR00255 family)
MIVSMTGYGKAEGMLPNKKISIEIKSLNSKQIDMNVRMPGSYREKELEVRQQIGAQLKRGKIDVSFFVEHTGVNSNQSINKELVKEYYKQMKSLSEEVGSEDSIMDIVMRLPDVLKIEKESINENEWAFVQDLLNKAVHNIHDFRKSEGKALELDFIQRIDTIKSIVDDIDKTEKGRVEETRKRILDRLENLKVSVDQNRFEQELVYYIEKLDVTEEIVRLNNHLQYFKENLNSDESQGKKLGFICQEIGREVNTIGSKSNDAEMQQKVVIMKDELEKIKEQILNVL